ncbi:MAG: RNA 2',3'-cyclic phosphodiesterase [Patescibacteria group bacterium]
MRAYIAIFPDESLIQEAQKVMQTLDKFNLKLNLTPNHQLHLTLKFLGDEVEADVITKINQNLLVSLKQIPELMVRVQGLSFGFDPNDENPYALFIKVLPNNQLEYLKQIVDLTVRETGINSSIEPEFIPHITLARNYNQLQAEEVTMLRKYCNQVQFDFEFNVNQVKIVKSEMHQTGAVHTILQTIPLTKQN